MSRLVTLVPKRPVHTGWYIVIDMSGLPKSPQCKCMFLIALFYLTVNYIYRWETGFLLHCYKLKLNIYIILIIIRCEGECGLYGPKHQRQDNYKVTWPRKLPYTTPSSSQTTILQHTGSENMQTLKKKKNVEECMHSPNQF